MPSSGPAGARRHVQRTGRLDKNGQRRGGRRDGAGRPAKGEHASEAHKARPEVSRDDVVRVTLRLADGLGLTRRYLEEAVELAVERVRTSGFSIVHHDVELDHLALLVEASDSDVLGRGMQGFASAAARRINKAIREHTGRERDGTVFPDRYHAEVIRSPAQARRLIAPGHAGANSWLVR